jgi:cytoskeletal protein RodZ
MSTLRLGCDVCAFPIEVIDNQLGASQTCVMCKTEFILKKSLELKPENQDQDESKTSENSVEQFMNYAKMIFWIIVNLVALYWLTSHLLYSPQDYAKQYLAAKSQDSNSSLGGSPNIKVPNSSILQHNKGSKPTNHNPATQSITQQRSNTSTFTKPLPPQNPNSNSYTNPDTKAPGFNFDSNFMSSNPQYDVVNPMKEAEARQKALNELQTRQMEANRKMMEDNRRTLQENMNRLRTVPNMPKPPGFNN